MTDMLGMQGFGGGNIAYRQPPENPRPAVPEISASENNGSATFTKDQNLRGQNGSENVAKRDDTNARETRKEAAREDRAAYAPTDRNDTRQTREPRNDENVIAGPTPAFQASVLEVERDLKNVIAKVEAKRTALADEAAIAPRASAPEASEPTFESGAGTPAATSSDTAPVTTATKSAEPEVQTSKPETPDAPQAQTQPSDPAAAPSGPAAAQETPYQTGT